MSEYLTLSLVAVCMLAGVPLVFASVCGVLVGILQTLISVQEQSLVFSLRLLVVGLVVVGGTPFATATLVRLVHEALFMLPHASQKLQMAIP